MIMTNFTSNVYFTTSSQASPASISLFFDETDKGKYFTDVWTVEVGDKTTPFFLALDDKEGDITKDSEFSIPIMKSLSIAHILPISEHK